MERGGPWLPEVELADSGAYFPVKDLRSLGKKVSRQSVQGKKVSLSSVQNPRTLTDLGKLGNGSRQ